MALYIGLDIGTTTLSAVALDVAQGALLARLTLAHQLDVATLADRARGRAELDLVGLHGVVVESLSELAAALAERSSDVAGIGVTGQMHGLALMTPAAAPLGPAITWQDRRTLEQIPGSRETYLQRFVSQAGGPDAFERTGCSPAAGYLGVTLFWLALDDALPRHPARACLIPDALVAMLTGNAPCTDPTDGGSSGVFDIVARQWDWELIERLGLPRELFPPVREPGDRAGELLPDISEATGLPRVPVSVALGDNQASFLGAVHEPERSVLLNVGTGAQLSAQIEGYQRLEGLDTRYSPGQRYLLVAAGLFGGRSYAYLRDFYRQVGQTFYGARGDEEIYDVMTRLAADAPPGCDGLRCSPLFTGTRRDPSLRASFSGLSPENLTPGHLTRALLEGMASTFHTLYEEMLPLLGARTYLVGSGNGIRRNALFCQILADAFGMPLHIPSVEEEAATGAALIAARGAGNATRQPETDARLPYARIVRPSS
jgi:sugar (pentulose or hexulose) kinase